MALVDVPTWKQAVGRVFDITWDVPNNNWDAINPTAMAFCEQEIETAEAMGELQEANVQEIVEQYHWSSIRTSRLLKLLDWMAEARRTTQSWNDLLKETITTRPMPDQALAAIAASAGGSPRNQSFGDISAIGYS